jgi:hypothetical protein
MSVYKIKHVEQRMQSKEYRFRHSVDTTHDYHPQHRNYNVHQTRPLIVVVEYIKVINLLLGRRHRTLLLIEHKAQNTHYHDTPRRAEK